MRPQSITQERFMLSIDHAAFTGDTAIKVAKPSAQFVIDKVRYVNVTGLATSASNFFAIQVLLGAAVAATWSTETGEEGTIAANTFVDLVNGVSPLRVGAADAEIILNFDETGTATLPAGRLVIEGRYL